MVSLARAAGGVTGLVPQVGDFVATDEPLFNLYGDAATIDDEALQSVVEFGSERTMDQDPTFAVRIVIDIALKALSSAINDPTTAVLALDQLSQVLFARSASGICAQSLPDHRQQELQKQLELLDHEAERQFRYPEELAAGAGYGHTGIGRTLKQAFNIDSVARRSRLINQSSTTGKRIKNGNVRGFIRKWRARHDSNV